MKKIQKDKLIQLCKMGLEVLIILLTGIFIGFAALCLVHLLPIDKMYQNVQASKDVINSFAEIVPGYRSTAVDDFTDSIMINEAICQADVPLIEKVINNYQVNYWQGYTQQENLFRYLEGNEGYRYQGYSHYWGGHQVILKLLLLCFDYSDILILNYIVQTILMVLVIVGLCRTGREYAALPFSATVLTIMPIATGMSLQLSDIYYISMLGSLWLIYREKQNSKYKIEVNSKIKKLVYVKEVVIFLILGMLTSYFDFLTYPFVSLGIPLVFSVMYRDKEDGISQVINLIKNSVAWCVGYGGMWSGKWLLGSILSPESGSLSVALDSIRYRSSAMASDVNQLTIWDVLIKNMFVYVRRPTILLIGVIVICLLVKIILRKAEWKKDTVLSGIPYLLICMYPIAWYVVTKNHSYEHTFMAYRELAIATFGGLMMLAGWGENTGKEHVKSEKVEIKK